MSYREHEGGTPAGPTAGIHPPSVGKREVAASRELSRSAASTSEAGEGRMSFLFWLLVIAAVIAFSVQYLPVRIASDRYQDFLVETAEKKNRLSKERLTKGLLERADELDLPLEKDGIEISVSSRRIRLRAEYTVPIDFLVYTWNWHKVHEVDREIFRF